MHLHLSLGNIFGVEGCFFPCDVLQQLLQLLVLSTYSEIIFVVYLQVAPCWESISWIVQ